MKKTAEQLIKENILFKKPTGQGLHVSLKYEKVVEIKLKIKKLLGVTIN